MGAFSIILIITGVILFGLAVLFLESYRELHRFKIKEYRVSLDQKTRGRILFLSDYHEAVHGSMNKKLLDRAESLNPDLILVGGDMVNGTGSKEDLQPAVDLIKGLAKIAPLYYAYGNHEWRMITTGQEQDNDWDGYVRQLGPGVHFLINESVTVPLAEGKLHLYGLNLDMTHYRKDGDPLTLEKLKQDLGEAKKDAPVVLLAHDPSWGAVYSQWGADLTLAGHFHGGVIRFPFIGGFVSPKYALFPHYDYGMYQEGENKMLVTSGLGQHTIPVRFNNLPEMVLVDFV